MRIKEDSRITALNFKLSDTVFLGYSDGSIIKLKLNEQPINLLYDHTNLFLISAEDEFEKIKSVFSSDIIRMKQSGSILNFSIKEDNSIDFNNCGVRTSGEKTKAKGKHFIK